MSRNIDFMIEKTTKRFRFAFDEFNYVEGYPRLVVLDPGEARILMWFYLAQSCLIYLKVENGLLSSAGWDNWMFSHAQQRLADLLEAGLLTPTHIDNWLRSRPISIDFDKVKVPADALGFGEYGEIDSPDDREEGVSRLDESKSSRNIDALIERTRESVCFHFDDFRSAEGHPSVVILYPGEAEILAQFYLKQHWLVDLQTQVFPFGNWDLWMIKRCEWRLPELVETGLISEDMEGEWWRVHPVPDEKAELEKLEADAKHGADVSSNAEGEPKEEESLCTETDEVPF